MSGLEVLDRGNVGPGSCISGDGGKHCQSCRASQEVSWATIMQWRLYRRLIHCIVVCLLPVKFSESRKYVL